MPIDEENLRARDPRLFQLPRMEFEPGIALPKHGTFAGRTIYQNPRALAFAALRDGPVRFDARSPERLLLQRSGAIVADLANITRA